MALRRLAEQSAMSPTVRLALGVLFGVLRRRSVPGSSVCRASTSFRSAQRNDDSAAGQGWNKWDIAAGCEYIISARSIGAGHELPLPLWQGIRGQRWRCGSTPCVWRYQHCRDGKN
jgi:hypothetical protein